MTGKKGLREAEEDYESVLDSDISDDESNWSPAFKETYRKFHLEQKLLEILRYCEKYFVSDEAIGCLIRPYLKLHPHLSKIIRPNRNWMNKFRKKYGCTTSPEGGVKTINRFYTRLAIPVIVNPNPNLQTPTRRKAGRPKSKHKLMTDDVGSTSMSKSGPMSVKRLCQPGDIDSEGRGAETFENSIKRRLRNLSGGGGSSDNSDQTPQSTHSNDLKTRGGQRSKLKKQKPRGKSRWPGKVFPKAFFKKIPEPTEPPPIEGDLPNLSIAEVLDSSPQLPSNPNSPDSQATQDLSLSQDSQECQYSMGDEIGLDVDDLNDVTSFLGSMLPGEIWGLLHHGVGEMGNEGQNQDTWKWVESLESSNVPNSNLNDDCMDGMDDEISIETIFPPLSPDDDIVFLEEVGPTSMSTVPKAVTTSVIVHPAPQTKETSPQVLLPPNIVTSDTSSADDCVITYVKLPEKKSKSSEKKTGFWRPWQMDTEIVENPVSKSMEMEKVMVVRQEPLGSIGISRRPVPAAPVQVNMEMRSEMCSSHSAFLRRSQQICSAPDAFWLDYGQRAFANSGYQNWPSCMFHFSHL